ncbi:hypothetical protein AVEN_165094-1 [Araneus ventricosus]|uniref:Uncharacterized protein n=1 Tax=Araneus ventricosus TaxID=182803 RepID=A0A4Y2ATC7_ARAVE|nr:hypothetical protein AVEN_165094-1 [Araneus ventricosus]
MILTDFLPQFYQGRVCKYASGLIIGGDQRVTARLLSALLVGSIQTIPGSSSSEPLWVCLRRGRFTTGFMALTPSSQMP